MSMRGRFGSITVMSAPNSLISIDESPVASYFANNSETLMLYMEIASLSFSSATSARVFCFSSEVAALNSSSFCGEIDAYSSFITVTGTYTAVGGTVIEKILLENSMYSTDSDLEASNLLKAKEIS